MAELGFSPWNAPRHFSRAPAARASCVLGANVLGPMCPTCVMRNQTERCGRWVAVAPDHGGAGPHAGPGGGLPRPHRGWNQRPGRTGHPPVPPGIHCHCCYHKCHPNQFASSSPSGGRPCYFSPRLIRNSTIRNSRWPLSIDRSSLVVCCLSVCGCVFEFFIKKRRGRPMGSSDRGVGTAPQCFAWPAQSTASTATTVSRSVPAPRFRSSIGILRN